MHVIKINSYFFKIKRYNHYVHKEWGESPQQPVYWTKVLCLQHM